MYLGNRPVDANWPCLFCYQKFCDASLFKVLYMWLRHWVKAFSHKICWKLWDRRGAWQRRLKFPKFIASSINAFRCLRLWCGNHPLINNAHCATSFLNLLQGTTFSKLRSSLAGARAHIQSKWQTINSCANDKNQFHFKCRSRPHKLNNFCGAKKPKNFFGIFSHFCPIGFDLPQIVWKLPKMSH